MTVQLDTTLHAQESQGLDRQGVGAACCADVETAAHFDNWQRSGRDAQNRRQDLWPPSLRAARTIPGVEYIQVPTVRSISCLLAGDLRA